MTSDKINKKEIILYIIFGLLTTAINMISYAILYDIFKVSNVFSTCISWFIAVCFAFSTNKKYVFQKQEISKKNLIGQLVSFFMCRFLTGLLDVVIMVLSVDYLKLNALLWKFISNVIVTIINYVASKFFIFKVR